MQSLKFVKHTSSLPTGQCINYLYVMAYTSNLIEAGSDSRHRIRLQVNGSASTRFLRNLPGDDHSPNRGDIWKFNLTDFFGFTGCITVNDIDNITILYYFFGRDGWNIESIVTFAVVSEYWELTSANFNVFQWIDGDSEDEFTLSLLTSTGKYICFQYNYIARLKYKVV